MTKKNVNFVKKKNNPHVWLRKTKSDGAWRYIKQAGKEVKLSNKGPKGAKIRHWRVGLKKIIILKIMW